MPTPETHTTGRPPKRKRVRRGFFGRLWTRIQRPIVRRILHLDDSPHRIALGVFLGFLVGWTPTMGLQILIYLVLAYACRANRASGLLPVFLTNPITAVPVYYLNWRIGRWILHPGGLSEAALANQRAAITAFVDNFQVSRIFDADFWNSIGPAFQAFGLELIVGCLVFGLACGLAGYIATYYGVIIYRRRRAKKTGSASRSGRPVEDRDGGHELIWSRSQVGNTPHQSPPTSNV